MANLVAQSDIERRSFIRLPDTLPVKARFLNNRVLPFDATTRDISEGGVALNTNINKELLSQKDITLEIAIPSKNFSLNVKATIVWSTAKNNNINALGVKFIDIPELARNYLKNYILEKISPRVGNEEKPQEFLRKPDLELREREKRNLSILDILRRRGSISKVEISQLVGLNIGTISNYVEEYIKKGIVFEKGLDVSSGGRRPNLLELNPDYSFSIGIDLSDRDYLKAVLADFSGKMINKIKEERNNRWDNINQRLSDLVNELVDTSKISFGKLRGIGLGVGSYTNNYHPIKNFLEKTFGLAVLVENSCSASIFAE
ncbi:MAG: PilZ domain-containing protein, partial [Candidatus Omnitrophota bacterium]